MKKFLSYFLCAAMILGITGCSETGGPAVTTPDPNPVDVSDIDLDEIPKEIDIKGKVVKYLGGYDVTEAGDIKPAYVYFKETYGADIEVLKHSGDLMEKLSTMMQSGESPDLMDQQSNSFPYYIGKNTYTALDDYMDLSAPQWKDVSGFIDKCAIDGKHYYYPWAYYVSPNVLIYNRGKFKELAIDDPKELYDKNEWTWDAMAKCMKDFVDGVKADDPLALGLFSFMNTGFINSTGVALVDFKDGQLVSNLNDPNVDRAQSFLENLKKQGLMSYNYNGDASVNVVIEGHAAFEAVGDWKITDYSKEMVKDDTLDIFFVPYPRDPNADKYYHKLDTFGYFVPAGAPNVEASCVFINCVRLSKLDEKLMETTRKSIMNEKKYTEEQYELWVYFQNSGNFNSDQLISDFARNLDKDTFDNVITKLTESVPFNDNEDTESWTVMRTSMGPLLDRSLSEINATLKG